MKGLLPLMNRVGLKMRGGMIDGCLISYMDQLLYIGTWTLNRLVLSNLKTCPNGRRYRQVHSVGIANTYGPSFFKVLESIEEIKWHFIMLHSRPESGLRRGPYRAKLDRRRPAACLSVPKKKSQKFYDCVSNPHSIAKTRVLCWNDKMCKNWEGGF